MRNLPLSLTYTLRRSPRNQGPSILNVLYYAARLELFLNRWHSEGPTSGMSHLSVLWCGRQRVTIVGNCKARVNCKGSVVRQLASRWANDGPAGQLSRSQWVWLWDVPEVLVCLHEIHKTNTGHPLPVCHPVSPLTRASTVELQHRNQFKQLFLCWGYLFGGLTSVENSD